MLKNTFIELISNYTDDIHLPLELWTEITHNYSGPKRHYHTLTHLENLLTELFLVKEEIQNWDAILFTLFYHDVIYNSLKSDNEVESAVLAEKRMQQISVPTKVINDCVSLIIATEKHLKSDNSDTNIFLDADLSVLGADWETYSQYFKSVRKEYAIYPAIIYNPGRKKVLKHFSEMDCIFKTDYFVSKFEEKAKYNIRRELELL